MPVFSDTDIQAALREGRLTIDPFDPSQLTSNGYDVAIAEVLVGRGKEPTRKGRVSIPPKAWFAIGTREYVRLGPELTAQIWLRSSWARRGVLGSFGYVDAGFEGTLTLSAFNAGDSSLPMAVGDTFAQLVFAEVRSAPAKPYGGRGELYQGQRGLTLARTRSRRA